jgi:hypothetical protein
VLAPVLAFVVLVVDRFVGCGMPRSGYCMFGGFVEGSFRSDGVVGVKERRGVGETIRYCSVSKLLRREIATYCSRLMASFLLS